jgi:polysaccharide biosynthesis/export protein PslD
MNTPRLAFVLVLMSLAACTHTWVDAKYQRPTDFAKWVDTAPGPYRIVPGDDISVVLPLNSELNYRGLVAPDGTLTMPFAGTVPAAGLSAPQLADTIDTALASRGIVANAQAMVGVAQSASRIYVGGEVTRPGEVSLHTGMSVMQAVTAAQGLLDTARTHEIVLIRRSPDGRPMLRTIDVDALTRKGDPNQDVILQANDTIFVPKSSIAEVDQWVDQYINKVLPFDRGFSYSITNGTTTTNP